MCFSHPQNLLAGWAGPSGAAGHAKIWDDFAAAWRARKSDDGSQGPRPSLAQWVARQTEDLPEGKRTFARAVQLRRIEIDGGSVMEWDALPEYVKATLEASAYDKTLFDSPLQAYLSLSGTAGGLVGGPISCASQGRDMLAFIAPGESFSDEDAMWWRGHVLGTTSQTHRTTVKRIRSSSKADLTVAQVVARSGLSTEEVEAADRGIEGQREATRRAAENREAEAEAQGGRSESAARKKRHREAAEQQKTFECPLCFKEYKSKDGRNKHLRQGKCCNDEEKHAAAMEKLGLGGGTGSGQRGKPKGPSSKKGKKYGPQRARR